MMIAGFAITAGVAGHLLEPYSPLRLLAVTSAVSLGALVVTVLALHRLEGHTDAQLSNAAEAADEAPPPFRVALAQVWREPVARRFTIFVFVSMLAYSAQDLILEPFAGQVFGYSPGASTQLAGVQHGGVLLGMLLVAGAGALSARWGARHALWRALGSLRGWAVAGCVASALALFGLVAAGLSGGHWPLKPTVFLLGVANGAFSIGAIGSMMRLANEGRHRREGVRMGLWGAAQAVSFGLGGLVGTAASDLARWLIAAPGLAYASVFALEGALFLLSAALAWQIGSSSAPTASLRPTPRPARHPSGDGLSLSTDPR
jgi:BCD family chlorophyll transporter-like MFS transporter